MRTDKLSLVIGYCGLFCVTVPYAAQSQDAALVWMHLIMAVILLFSTMTVMWRGNRVNLIGGVFCARYTVTSLFGMARVIYLGSFTSDEIVWCYSVTTVAAILIAMGHICARTFRSANSVHLSEPALHSRYTEKPRPGAFLALVLASAASWAANIAAQGGLRSYLAASYGLRVANTPPHFLLMAMFIEFPLYYLTWGVLLSPEYRRLRPAALLWVALSVARFLAEGRSGFILFAALVPVMIMYLRDYAVPRRVSRAIMLAVVGAMVGLVVSSAVRFGRSREPEAVPFVGRGFVERVVASSTFDACEHLIRVNSFYRDSKMNGINIVAPFISWIPRRLWPQKPVQLGRRIVIDIYGAPADTPISFPVHLLGDFSADFGMIGVLSLPFMVGVLLGIVDSRYHRRWNHMRLSGTRMAEYVAVGLSLSSMCNSFSSGLLGALYMMPFWLLWKRLNMLRPENTRNPIEPRAKLHGLGEYACVTPQHRTRRTQLNS